MKKNYQKTALTLLFFVLFVCSAKAQFGIFAGANISNVQHRNLLLNEKGIPNNYPLFGYFSGLSFQFYPIKSAEKLSFGVDLGLNQKGYVQKFSDATFVKRLIYIALPVLINYDFNEKFSMHTGVEFAGLMLPWEPLNDRKI